MLGLEGSAVTDADLARLVHLPGLESLDLSNTGITDAALDHVRAAPTLETLILIGTKVTPAAVKRLKKDMPDLTVQTKPRRGKVINPFADEPM